MNCGHELRSRPVGHPVIGLLTKCGGFRGGGRTLFLRFRSSARFAGRRLEAVL